MNLLCYCIFPRFNPVFSLEKCVLLLISASVMGISGAPGVFSTEIELSFYWIFLQIVWTAFCLFRKDKKQKTRGANSKIFGYSLFVTKVLVLGVSMLIQDKSMSLPHANSPKIKKKSDVKICDEKIFKYYMKVLSNSVFIVSHPISKTHGSTKKKKKKNISNERKTFL